MLYNLREVFNNRIFRIPAYQRGYSWEKKHLEQLWDDIANINYPYPENSYHFTGVLTLNVFKEEDLERLRNENHGYNITADGQVQINNRLFNPVHLVDGQQRMTSLLILNSILIDLILERDDFGDETKEEARQSKANYLVLVDNDNLTKHLFGYDTDVPSHQYLLNRIFDDETIQCTEPETLYTNKLIEAKRYFFEKILPLENVDIENLFHKIERRLLFSVLELNDGNDREIDVSMAFETLNFRGKSLSDLELFKNRLLFLISKTTYTAEVKTEIKNDIIRTWLEIYKWIGANQEKELNDDEFLKAFWLLYFSRASMVSNDFKSLRDKIFNELFSLSENPDNNPNLMRGITTGIHHWLRIMRKSIELWFIIKNPYYFDDNENVSTIYYLRDDVKNLLYKINNIPNNTGIYVQNLILAILHRHLRTNEDWNDEDLIENNEENYRILEELLRLIERHHFGCFILNGNKTTFNREKIFRCVNSYFERGRGARLENGNIIDLDLTDYFREELIDAINLNDINRHIHRDYHYFDWIGVEYFLIHWEIYLARMQNVDLSFEAIKKQRIQVSKIVSNVNDQIFINLTQNTRERYLYSLGNMFLSRPRGNHYDLDHLQERIRQSDNPTFNERNLLNFNLDSRDDIFERGKRMFSFLVRNWNLEGDLGNPENYSHQRWEQILLDH